MTSESNEKNFHLLIDEFKALMAWIGKGKALRGPRLELGPCQTVLPPLSISKRLTQSSTGLESIEVKILVQGPLHHTTIAKHMPTMKLKKGTRRVFFVLVVFQTGFWRHLFLNFHCSNCLG